ncbi:Glycosyltransferase, catalytic subunit of cellulose synthase and poly-beta-1,6-N-acetylglucosamine synthase [Filimonas lacunae]|uniref:Glycosyltransferase, catalytic subunit of cellulose synthase and poly-beta-1,6-N-acetylglucosamine synthase n=2 Tax=Filimonas lacunae TaxID=477680 RepID=A0A173MQU6_9BACT|nr:N-acetylglucosaminyltransferase [Filimonas lacunae]SIS80185.1 Glycosyltransferase, catalytic subunit of cellulose synthase and poly-beta-1,6-N-acetylglucosamine synthase [Filimonas lacunae]
MNILLTLSSVLLLLYAVLILFYRQWFLKLQLYVKPAGMQPATRFSVIIPARDEEEQIGACVLAILQQHYPAYLYEVIVIDDHSTDNTAAIIQQLQQTYANLHLMQLAKELQGQQLNSYKKKAIEMAIGRSTGDWIITTDADCALGPQWLATYNAYIQEQRPVFVAAPVMFSSPANFVGIFQCLDFMSMQGITAAAVSAGVHSMCNGANLAYNKEAFYAVGGFKGIDAIASGDDMLLMHKIKQAYPGKTGYIFSADAIVSTAPMPDWKSFINQRIRWASKADKYKDKAVFWVLVLVYCMNLCLLLLLLTGLIHWAFMGWALALIGIKTVVELCFLFPVARFFNQCALLNWFAIMQPFHIAYIVVAGWLGKFGKYQWKGRTVK